MIYSINLTFFKNGAILWYKMKDMTLEELEAQLLLNQDVVVTSHRSQFTGRNGHVKGIMPDGRTLDVTLDDGKEVFLDVTLVGEIRERTPSPKQEQSLGPIANSVVQDGI